MWLTSWKSLTKIVGSGSASGSISQRSADPEPKFHGSATLHEKRLSHLLMEQEMFEVVEPCSLHVMPAAKHLYTCCPLTSVADPGCLSRIRFFSIPDPHISIPDPRSASKNFSILTQKMVSKLEEIWSGLFIPDPDPYFLPIPDPGSGSATATLSLTGENIYT